MITALDQLAVRDSRPCVIYAHCNSGSRRDAEEALYVLLPHNITVFCLDFAVRLQACVCLCQY